MENKWRIFKNHHQQQINKAKKPKTIIICKKHSKHQQSPGVCSICLSEKLSKLSKTSRIINTTSSCSSSSSLSSLSSSSSYDVSSCSSPAYRRMKTMATLRGGGNINVLTKSRSLVFVTTRKDGEFEENGKNKDKKRGLLSKLLHPRKNKN
uniref:Avr9/Cf-9 rapidly elicited protein 75 n=1 Tax=Solanum tuberosum TaxID=4113 RepID=M1BI94_SOLTU